MTNNQISKINIYLYIALSLSIFLGLYFGEDSSGNGGFIGDFKGTLSLVKDPLNYSTIVDFKFPLHYYLTGIIYYFSNNELTLRIIYCCVSLITPYIFFMCLREKFKNIDKNNLFLFSLVIFILPSFRSGAIWPNTQVTALVFFLASLYNFVKWQNLNNYKTINNSLLYSIFFMSMAVYSRQLYALIFLYYVYIFFLNYNFKKFFQVSLLIFFLAVPGIYFVFQNPNIAAVTFNASLYNSLLVNSSIISFYLIPFFVILLIDKKLGINFQNRNYFYIPVLSLIIVVVLAQSFNYNFRMGGGYFIKLSILLFDNLYFFYLSSIIGFICILSLIKKNFLILFLLIFGFSSWLIFQKYFEPMFLILLFLIFQTSLTRKFLESKRNIMAYLFFIGLYFLTALANNLFKITGTI